MTTRDLASMSYVDLAELAMRLNQRVAELETELAHVYAELERVTHKPAVRQRVQSWAVAYGTTPRGDWLIDEW